MADMGGDLQFTIILRAIDEASAVLTRQRALIEDNTAAIRGFNGAQDAAVATAATHTDATTKAATKTSALAGAARLAAGGVGVLAAGMLVGGVVAAARFDDSLAVIRGNTLSNTAQMAEMRKGILQLGAESPASLDQIAKGFEHAANLGYRGAAAFQLVSIAMKSAVATGGDVGETLNTLVTEMKNFHIQLPGASQAMNQLMEAAAKGNMRLPDLVANFQKVAMVASGMKQPLSEALGLFSALTEGTGSAAAAQVLETNLLMKMLHPTATAQAAMASLGEKTGINLAQVYRDVAAGTMSLHHGIELTFEALTKGKKDASDIATIFGGMRGSIGALHTLNKEGMAQYLDILGKVAHAHGELDKAFNDMMKTWGAQWGYLVNQVRLTAIALGGALLPGVIAILHAINPIAAAIRAWTQANPQLAAGILAVTAAVALLTFGLGALAFLFSSIRLMPSFAGAPGYLRITGSGVMSEGRRELHPDDGPAPRGGGRGRRVGGPGRSGATATPTPAAPRLNPFGRVLPEDEAALVTSQRQTASRQAKLAATQAAIAQLTEDELRGKYQQRDALARIIDSQTALASRLASEDSLAAVEADFAAGRISRAERNRQVKGQQAQKGAAEQELVALGARARQLDTELAGTTRPAEKVWPTSVVMTAQHDVYGEEARRVGAEALTAQETLRRWFAQLIAEAADTMPALGLRVPGVMGSVLSGTPVEHGTQIEAALGLLTKGLAEGLASQIKNTDALIRVADLLAKGFVYRGGPSQGPSAGPSPAAAPGPTPAGPAPAGAAAPVSGLSADEEAALLAERTRWQASAQMWADKDAAYTAQHGTSSPLYARRATNAQRHLYMLGEDVPGYQPNAKAQAARDDLLARRAGQAAPPPDQAAAPEEPVAPAQTVVSEEEDTKAIVAAELAAQRTLSADFIRLETLRQAAIKNGTDDATFWTTYNAELDDVLLGWSALSSGQWLTRATPLPGTTLADFDAAKAYPIHAESFQRAIQVELAKNQYELDALAQMQGEQDPAYLEAQTARGELTKTLDKKRATQATAARRAARLADATAPADITRRVQYLDQSSRLSEEVTGLEGQLQTVDARIDELEQSLVQRTTDSMAVGLRPVLAKIDALGPDAAGPAYEKLVKQKEAISRKGVALKNLAGRREALRADSAALIPLAPVGAFAPAPYSAEAYQLLEDQLGTLLLRRQRAEEEVARYEHYLTKEVSPQAWDQERARLDAGGGKPSRLSPEVQIAAKRHSLASADLEDINRALFGQLTVPADEYVPSRPRADRLWGKKKWMEYKEYSPTPESAAYMMRQLLYMGQQDLGLAQGPGGRGTTVPVEPVVPHEVAQRQMEGLTTRLMMWRLPLPDPLKYPPISSQGGPANVLESWAKTGAMTEWRGLAKDLIPQMAADLADADRAKAMGQELVAAWQAIIAEFEALIPLETTAVGRMREGYNLEQAFRELFPREEAMATTLAFAQAHAGNVLAEGAPTEDTVAVRRAVSAIAQRHPRLGISAIDQVTNVDLTAGASPGNLPERSRPSEPGLAPGSPEVRAIEQRILAARMAYPPSSTGPRSEAAKAAIDPLYAELDALLPPISEEERATGAVMGTDVRPSERLKSELDAFDRTWQESWDARDAEVNKATAQVRKLGGRGDAVAPVITTYRQALREQEAAQARLTALATPRPARELAAAQQAAVETNPEVIQYRAQADRARRAQAAAQDQIAGAERAVQQWNKGPAVSSLGADEQAERARIVEQATAAKAALPGIEQELSSWERAAGLAESAAIDEWKAGQEKSITQAKEAVTEAFALTDLVGADLAAVHPKLPVAIQRQTALLQARDALTPEAKQAAAGAFLLERHAAATEPASPLSADVLPSAAIAGGLGPEHRFLNLPQTVERGGAVADELKAWLITLARGAASIDELAIANRQEALAVLDSVGKTEAFSLESGTLAEAMRRLGITLPDLGFQLALMSHGSFTPAKVVEQVGGEALGIAGNFDPLRAGVQQGRDYLRSGILQGGLRGEGEETGLNQFIEQVLRNPRQPIIVPSGTPFTTPAEPAASPEEAQAAAEAAAERQVRAKAIETHDLMSFLGQQIVDDVGHLAEQLKLTVKVLSETEFSPEILTGRGPLQESFTATAGRQLTRMGAGRVRPTYQQTAEAIYTHPEAALRPDALGPDLLTVEERGQLAATAADSHARTLAALDKMAANVHAATGTFSYGAYEDLSKEIDVVRGMAYAFGDALGRGEQVAAGFPAVLLAAEDALRVRATAIEHGADIGPSEAVPQFPNQARAVAGAATARASTHPYNRSGASMSYEKVRSLTALSLATGEVQASELEPSAEEAARARLLELGEQLQNEQAAVEHQQKALDRAGQTVAKGTAAPDALARAQALLRTLPAEIAQNTARIELLEKELADQTAAWKAASAAAMPAAAAPTPASTPTAGTVGRDRDAAGRFIRGAAATTTATAAATAADDLARATATPVVPIPTPVTPSAPSPAAGASAVDKYAQLDALLLKMNADIKILMDRYAAGAGTPEERAALDALLPKKAALEAAMSDLAGGTTVADTTAKTTTRTRRTRAKAGPTAATPPPTEPAEEEVPPSVAPTAEATTAAANAAATDLAAETIRVQDDLAVVNARLQRADADVARQLAGIRELSATLGDFEGSMAFGYEESTRPEEDRRTDLHMAGELRVKIAHAQQLLASYEQAKNYVVAQAKALDDQLTAMGAGNAPVVGPELPPVVPADTTAKTGTTRASTARATTARAGTAAKSTQFARDFPAALGAAGIRIDRISRHPTYGTDDQLINVQVDDTAGKASVTPLGGQAIRVNSDIDTIVATVKAERDRLLAVRMSTDEFLVRLHSAYLDVAKSLGVTPGSTVPIREVIAQLNRTGTAIRPDEFAVDLARAMRARQDVAGQQLGLQRTRDTDRGLFLPGMMNHGLVGRLVFRSAPARRVPDLPTVDETPIEAPAPTGTYSVDAMLPLPADTLPDEAATAAPPPPRTEEDRAEALRLRNRLTQIAVTTRKSDEGQRHPSQTDAQYASMMDRYAAEAKKIEARLRALGEIAGGEGGALRLPGTGLLDRLRGTTPTSETPVAAPAGARWPAFTASMAGIGPDVTKTWQPKAELVRTHLDAIQARFTAFEQGVSALTNAEVADLEKQAAYLTAVTGRIEQQAAKEQARNELQAAGLRAPRGEVTAMRRSRQALLAETTEIVASGGAPGPEQASYTQSYVKMVGMAEEKLAKLQIERDARSRELRLIDEQYQAELAAGNLGEQEVDALARRYAAQKRMLDEDNRAIALLEQATAPPPPKAGQALPEEVVSYGVENQRAWQQAAPAIDARTKQIESGLNTLTRRAGSQTGAALATTTRNIEDYTKERAALIALGAAAADLATRFEHVATGRDAPTRELAGAQTAARREYDRLIRQPFAPAPEEPRISRQPITQELTGETAAPSYLERVAAGTPLDTAARRRTGGGTLVSRTAVAPPALRTASFGGAELDQVKAAILGVQHYADIVRLASTEITDATDKEMRARVEAAQGEKAALESVFGDWSTYVDHVKAADGTFTAFRLGQQLTQAELLKLGATLAAEAGGPVNELLVRDQLLEAGLSKLSAAAIAAGSRLSPLGTDFTRLAELAGKSANGMKDAALKAELLKAGLGAADAEALVTGKGLQGLRAYLQGVANDEEEVTAKTGRLRGALAAMANPRGGLIGSALSRGGGGAATGLVGTGGGGASAVQQEAAAEEELAQKAGLAAGAVQQHTAKVNEAGEASSRWEKRLNSTSNAMMTLSMAGAGVAGMASGTLANSLSMVLGVAGSLAMVVPMVSGLFTTGLTPAITGAATALKGFIVEEMLTPVGLVILAAALVALAYVAIKPVRDAINALVAAINSKLIAAWYALQAAVGAVASNFDSLGKVLLLIPLILMGPITILGALGAILGVLAYQHIPLVHTAVDDVTKAFENFWAMITKGTNPLTWLLAELGKFKDLLTAIAGGVAGAVGSFFGGIFSAAGGALASKGHEIDQHRTQTDAARKEAAAQAKRDAQYPHHPQGLHGMTTRTTAAQVQADRQAADWRARHPNHDTTPDDLKGYERDLKAAIAPPVDPLAAWTTYLTNTEHAAIASATRLADGVVAQVKRLRAEVYQPIQVGPLRLPAVPPALTATQFDIAKVAHVTGPYDNVATNYLPISQATAAGHIARAQDLLGQRDRADYRRMPAVALTGAGPQMGALEGAIHQLPAALQGAMGPVAESLANQLTKVENTYIDGVNKENRRDTDELRKLYNDHRAAILGAEASAQQAHKDENTRYLSALAALNTKDQQDRQAHLQMMLQNDQQSQSNYTGKLAQIQATQQQQLADKNSKESALWSKYTQDLAKIHGAGAEAMKAKLLDAYHNQKQGIEDTYAKQQGANTKAIDAATKTYNDHVNGQKRNNDDFLAKQRTENDRLVGNLNKGHQASDARIQTNLDTTVHGPKGLDAAYQHRVLAEQATHRRNQTDLTATLQSATGPVKQAAEKATTPSAIWDAASKGAQKTADSSMKALDLAVLDGAGHLHKLAAQAAAGQATLGQLSDAQAQAALLVAEAGGDLTTALKTITDNLNKLLDQYASAMMNHTLGRSLGLTPEQRSAIRTGETGITPETHGQQLAAKIMDDYKKEARIDIVRQQTAQRFAPTQERMERDAGLYDQAWQLHTQRVDTETKQATGEINLGTLDHDPALVADGLRKLAKAAGDNEAVILANRTSTQAWTKAQLDAAQAAGDAATYYDTFKKKTSDETALAQSMAGGDALTNGGTLSAASLTALAQAADDTVRGDQAATFATQAWTTQLLSSARAAGDAALYFDTFKGQADTEAKHAQSSVGGDFELSGHATAASLAELGTAADDTVRSNAAARYVTDQWTQALLTSARTIGDATAYVDAAKQQVDQNVTSAHNQVLYDLETGASPGKLATDAAASQAAGQAQLVNKQQDWDATFAGAGPTEQQQMLVSRTSHLVSENQTMVGAQSEVVKALDDVTKAQQDAIVDAITTQTDAIKDQTEVMKAQADLQKVGAEGQITAIKDQDAIAKAASEVQLAMTDADKAIALDNLRVAVDTQQLHRMETHWQQVQAQDQIKIAQAKQAADMQAGAMKAVVDALKLKVADDTVTLAKAHLKLAMDTFVVQTDIASALGVVNRYQETIRSDIAMINQASDQQHADSLALANAQASAAENAAQTAQSIAADEQQLQVDTTSGQTETLAQELKIARDESQVTMDEIKQKLGQFMDQQAENAQIVAGYWRDLFALYAKTGSTRGLVNGAAVSTLDTLNNYSASKNVT